MAFEGISVSISAQTADFTAGIQSAKGRAEELSDSLGQLSRRARGAEDELGDAGRQATTTAGLFSALSLSTSGLSLSFGTLSTGITATLIPALIALSTTLVPLTLTVGGLVAGVTALGGAFGVVLGSGLLAFSERAGGLEEVLNSLREQIKPLIVEFGQQFVPLIKDGVNALPGLVKSTLSAIGPLDDFVDALRSIGRTARTAIPAIVGRLADLARRILPAVESAAGGLAGVVPGIFDTILRTTEAVLPSLRQIGGSFVDALPAINRFGTAVIQTLAPAVSEGVRLFGDLLDRLLRFGQSSDFTAILSEIQTGFAEIKPELQLVADELGSLFSKIIEEGPSIIRGLFAVADAILDIANPILDVVIPVVNKLIDIFGFLSEQFAGFSEASGSMEPLELSDLTPSMGQAGGGQAGNTPAPGMSPTGLPQQGTVQIELQENTDVVDARIRDGAESVVREREDRATRNTGGTTQP